MPFSRHPHGRLLVFLVKLLYLGGTAKRLPLGERIESCAAQEVSV